MTSKLVLGAAVAALTASSSMLLAQTPPAQTQPQQSPAAPSTTPSPTPAPSASPSPSATTSPAVEMNKTEQAANDWRSSKIVGLSVYNNAGENIGEVDDLVVSNDGRIQNAVLGVGGFLGMGEKLVAVPFADLKMSRDDRGNIHLVLNSSRESLQSAPEFHYQGDTKR